MKLWALALAALLVASAGCICAPPSEGSATTTTSSLEPSTTTQAPASSTTTSIRPTTTTLRPTTTTAKPLKTTTSTASTSTTAAPAKNTRKTCQTTADCGGEKTYLSCNSNKILKYTEKPTCINSPDGSYCLASLRSSLVDACSDSDYCVNATCKPRTSLSDSIEAASLTTSTTMKFTFPKMSTTTNTIPPATTCMGRSASGSARSQSDCNGLKCGTVIGGRTYTCQFIPGDSGTGHCTCK